MSTQALRTITIYATQGGKKEKIETDVTIWKDLKKIVKDKGFNVDKLLSTENVTRHDLVNDEALLPEGPFTLFMRPTQVKSGADLSYKEIKAAIKYNFENFPEAAKAHYNQGKNYTTKGTEELRSLLNSFVVPTSNGTEEASEPVAEPNTEVIEQRSCNLTKVVTNLDRVSQVETLLIEIKVNASSEDVIDRADEILEDYLPGLKAEVEADTNATVTNVANVVASVSASKEDAEEEGRIAARKKAEEAETARIAQENAAKAEAKRLEEEEDRALAEEAEKYR